MSPYCKKVVLWFPVKKMGIFAKIGNRRRVPSQMRSQPVFSPKRTSLICTAHVMLSGSTRHGAYCQNFCWEKQEQFGRHFKSREQGDPATLQRTAAATFVARTKDSKCHFSGFEGFGIGPSVVLLFPLPDRDTRPYIRLLQGYGVIMFKRLVVVFGRVRGRVD